MLLRVSGDAETELRLTRFEQRNELVRIAKTVRRDLEFSRTFRWIAAERHDVSEPRVVNSIGDLTEFGTRVSDARQVRHDREAEFVLQHPAHLRCPIPRRAPGSIGDGHEIR